MDNLGDRLEAAEALSRQNSGMPSRLDDPDMPERAAAAAQAVSGISRRVVLRYLLEHPGSSRTDLAQGTGLKSESVRSALKELESLEYVSGDVEGERRGRPVHYTARRDLLTDDLTAFVAWMLR